MLQTMWNIKWILVIVNTILLICLEGKLGHCLRGGEKSLKRIFGLGIRSKSRKRGRSKEKNTANERIDRLFAFVNIEQF
jgi:hypothetical protein